MRPCAEWAGKIPYSPLSSVVTCEIRNHKSGLDLSPREGVRSMPRVSCARADCRPENRTALASYAVTGIGLPPKTGQLINHSCPLQLRHRIMLERVGRQPVPDRSEVLPQFLDEETRNVIGFLVKKASH